MFPPVRRLFVSATALSLAAAGAASAVTLVNNGFETTTHPTGFRTVSSSTGIPFYAVRATDANNSASLTLDATSGFTGNVLSINGSTGSSLSFPVIGVLPSTALLTNVGDTISLSFDFRFTNTPTTNGAAFRFGIFGSNGTPVTGENQLSNSDNDYGYYVQVGAGTTPGVNSVLYVENGGTSPILGGGDRGSQTANNGGVAITDTAVHSASFTLTRNAGSIGVSTTILGTTTTANFATIYTSFDEIGFSNMFQSVNTQYNIDNVVVTATNVVPEPSVMGLCGLAMAGLGWWRPRRDRAAIAG